MTTPFVRLASAFCLLLSMTARPATVYHATFDAVDGWDNIGGVVSLDAGQLKFTVTDSTTVAQAYRASPEISDFTMSLQIRRETGSGIILINFCIQGSGATYDLLLSPATQRWNVRANLGTTAAYPLNDTMKVSSWINFDNNLVTISKSGTQFHIYFNGHLVRDFTDNTFSSGFFGIMTMGRITATFDDLIIDDTATTKGYDLSFSDNFDDGTLDGWIQPFGGGLEFAASSGLLCGNNTTPSSIHFLNNTGNYRDFSLTLDAINPPPTGDTLLFGIIFRQQLTANYPGYLVLLQLGAPKFISLKRLTDAANLRDWSQNLFIKNDTNRFAIRVVGDSINVNVNNHDILQYFDTAHSYPSGGIGLVVVGTSSMCFDNVVLTEIPTAVEARSLEGHGWPAGLSASPNPFNPSTVLTVNGNLNTPGEMRLTVYDLRGKSVASFDRRAIQSAHGRLAWPGTSAGALASGVYLARLQMAGKTFSLPVLLCK
jgi:hypothetical protein